MPQSGARCLFARGGRLRNYYLRSFLISAIHEISIVYVRAALESPKDFKNEPTSKLQWSNRGFA